MDKIQTPDVRHEESWWQLVMIAYTQLYLSRFIANNHPNPWEKYLSLFRRLVHQLNHPNLEKKAPGRQLGDIQIKRLRHAIVKKGKNKVLEEKLTA